ncbi:MAG TPA: bifunctional phosphoglucose/phosphomannose isomerase [Candidatus Saccharimonadales bacterium]|nr:bifunctional phosphoglucose/phosphomannose isomerase [Candidatus Saccharimonadales bacterium]
MLDDLKLIHERDKEDALGVAEKQWQQLQYNYDITTNYSDIKNIVVAGMGGSAFPAVFLQSWPGTTVPNQIVRDYNLPSYVDEHTLFISSSYSGNTEETLSALAEAEKLGAKIVIVTAGGKLLDIAKEKNYPLLVIPGGIQPRMSSFYFIAAFVQLLEPLKLVEQGSTGALAATGDWLKDQVGSWQATIPTSSNPAKQLALELVGKSVVVYSGPKLFPAANKFKICMNENAKNVAWLNQYPEFNHNEFIGWTSHPVEKPYGVVEIRSNLEHERIQKRFEISTQLLSGKRPDPEIINPKGNNLIEQLLWTSNFCDYVSLYIALLNGVDPTPVDLVEKLKSMLG